MPQKSSQRYLCDIVPMTHIPLTREQSFWYESTQNLTPGTLVRVPLFRRTVSAVVLSCKDDFSRAGGIKLKSVTHIVDRDHFTPQQIALAVHISETTFTSLGIVLRMFLIRDVQERLRPTHSDTTMPIPTMHHPELSAQILATRNTYKRWILRDTSATTRDELFITLIAQILSDNSTAQILFLLPEILITVHTAERLRKFFAQSDIVVVHNKTAKGTLSRIRDEVRSGVARIIIGTRKAITLPFTNLEMIIVDEEHDISFKNWDSAPRFDARSIAQFMGRIYSCPVIMTSVSPRLLRTPPILLAPQSSRRNIDIVDMRITHNERKKKNVPVGIISDQLADKMRTALKKNQQILLFLNHKGMSTFSVCTKCQTLLACPDCDRALILVAEGHYECVHCPFTTSANPQCAQCHNPVFRNVGYGTQKIERIVAKLFPDARIARADGHALRRTHSAQEIVQKFSRGEIDILIGTQMALKDWRIPRLFVVGILDADAVISIPDIYADERLFAHIANAVATVTHDASVGNVIVQTFHPEYATLTYAVTLDYTNFRKDILKLRKMLKYPPYWRVIKIIAQHKNQKRVQEIAQKFHQEIMTATQNDDTILVSDVHQPLLPKLRTYHRMQIIIKLQNTRGIRPIPVALADVLRTAPTRTIIDVDPISLV